MYYKLLCLEIQDFLKRHNSFLGRRKKTLLEKCGSSSVVCVNKLSYTVTSGDGVTKRRDVRYIGLNIHYIRKKVLRVSQEEFGYMVGMCKDTVSNIERGVYIPSVHHLVSISNCVNIPVDFFLYEIEEEPVCTIHTD